MPRFYNRDMQDLAHQLTLSPRRLRVEQLHHIEDLLSIVSTHQTYPFDFVTYHITKYRKRGPATAAMVPGRALVRDLLTMAEMLSRRSNIALAELGEDCKTHAELASELKVSTKTIRRWRDRGLLGLRVVYPDGVNRLAFCRGTIDRFVEKNRELVERGAAFTQLSDKERDQIVALARKLVAENPVKLHAAAKQIAEETGRAVETVRYTLRRFDSANPEQALFTKRGDPARCERHEAIWRCRQAGDSIESIAAAFSCTSDEIESVLRVVQLEKWQTTPIEYVYNELFGAPNADRLIVNVAEPAASSAPLQKSPKDLPPYLRSLYLTPLLTREQEQDLFRRYNYLKFKAANMFKRVSADSLTATQFDAIELSRGQIEVLRQRILQANLRLVVSVAKNHVGWSDNFFEVISDGNMSLMRAVEKFDYSRGYKFSTYATWAIVKNYARSVPEQHYYAARFVTGQDEVLDTVPDGSAAPRTSPADRERVRELIAAGLKQLPDREREIVDQHFGLTDGATRVTLEELGARLGVTKERIRQIEKSALARLRELLAPSLLDAFVS
ncbi:MAG: sigma-70 family RNA polymerase sigma factor [Planctomycetes bacterium]|nr:sigma-70 family RNA polymerase sigma factor [Planctomycetota bacterium]MBI3833064.1 sigma-70 family RNA polymerase sigma factor [Planctomycetota bacterium]